MTPANPRTYLAAQTDFDPARDWVYGMGWDQTALGGQFPTAADLDASPVLAAVPIALLRIDVHAVWLNGAALARLGALPDEVPGGEIVRDASGAPTGILLDDAMDLVLAAASLPSPAKACTIAMRPVEDAKDGPLTPARNSARLRTPPQLNEALDIALRECAQLGLTAVNEAGVTEGMLELYKARIDAGRFPLRNFGMVTCGERNTFCPMPRLDDYKGRLSARKYAQFQCTRTGGLGAALTSRPATVRVKPPPASSCSWTARWAAGARPCWRPTATRRPRQASCASRPSASRPLWINGSTPASRYDSRSMPMCDEGRDPTLPGGFCSWWGRRCRSTPSATGPIALPSMPSTRPRSASASLR